MPVAAQAQDNARSGIVPPDRADRRPATRPGRGRAVRQLPPQRDVEPTQRFTLRGVTIEGSTLGPAELTPAYTRFIGTAVDTTQMQAIINEIGQIYERSDIALYTII
jgi:hemolysin activation/secretion protein